MVTKKRQTTEQEIYGPAKLVISKEEFKKNLHDRVFKGKELFEKQINTQDDFESLKTDYSKWDDYNEEYLKQSFNYQNNQYFKDYSNSGFFVVGFGDEYISKKIQDKKEDIKRKVERLESLLEKVDLIPTDENIVVNNKEENQVSNIVKILNGFHKCAQELRHRYSNRDTIFLNDEYDVQDLLRSILKIFYNDVRAEDYSPSSAGGNSRIDLVLPKEGIIIETKMTSEKLSDKLIGEQIAIDIVRYQNHPSFRTLIVFIYDKLDFIRNKRGLISDLENQSRNGKEIIVIINPE